MLWMVIMKKKLENYGKVITNLSVLAAGIEEEEKRLNAKERKPSRTRLIV